ncbi:hypothetical protein ACFSKM_27935 [Ancylobacter dichloromethanicus]
MPRRFRAASAVLARRIAGWAAALAVILLTSSLPARAEIALTDVTGREVTLAAPAHRLLIDDGRFLIALALIHRDPVSVLAAWPRDINRIGTHTYEAYRAKFPAIDQLAKVASSAGALSVEQVVAARPDLAVFSLGAQPTPEERAHRGGGHSGGGDRLLHPPADQSRTEPDPAGGGDRAGGAGAGFPRLPP